ncbi:SMI1/KNR4 family protein [Lysobacter sp. CA199]|uniref:SMI1/KNR4 family protein n=1 Tax=Lysobacter sp. CA199 TaxID=3455608 RepID=UPI003F8D7947
MVYGRAPSLDSFWDEELNLGRAPASAESIAAVEARLDIVLPAWLRRLYARYDGGAVRMARAASVEAPGDWTKADWLVPRARLLPLSEWFSFAQLREREQYRDDAYIALAADDRRLIAIAIDEHNKTLCLDYSAEAEPAIVWTDHQRRLREYADAARWLADLVDLQFWSPALQARHDPAQTLQWRPEPPSLDTFWSGPGFWSDASGAPAPEDAIAAAEARLGVRLPALLRALYRRQDGGYTRFEWAPLSRHPSRHSYDWESVVPDRYLSSLGHLRTLMDVASDFQDGTELWSFARMHARCEQIVVLAMHNINWMLCLDYRERGPEREPDVVYFEYFDELTPRYRARDFDRFFADLRQAELD